MRMKLTAGVVLILMLVIVSSVVMAGEPAQLNLKTVVNKALENNLDFKIAILNREKADLEYQKNKANNLLQHSRYSELQSEINYKSAQNTYQNTRYQVINNTISSYTSLWLAKMDLDIKQKQAELQKLLLDEARAQYDIGDIGSVDLLQQENSYKDAQFSLETANDDYQQSVKEFSTSLNLDTNNFVLADLNYTGDWQVTEQEALDTALQNSVDLQLKEDQLELARIDLERAQVSAAKLDKQLKDISVDIAGLERDNTRESLKTSTQEAYYQFKQAVKKISLSRERLSEAEQKHQLRKEQFDAGLITRSEVLDYQVNMIQSQHDYNAAIADYIMKEEALRQKMSLKSGVLTDETTEKE